MQSLLKKYSFLAFFMLIVPATLPFPLFSQELLDNQNATWTTVLPGITICPPALTSYGLCLASDAKNVVAISSGGSILWEKSFARTKNITICALPSDFILLFDNDKNIMKLINPSGSVVWEKKIGFKVTDTKTNVFCGRDGRFIIKSNSEIQCYGINGVCRWKLSSLELKGLAAQELPDGSIIFFTSEKEAKTCGIRVSPYGNVMEEITFSGEVTASWWCNEGVLLSFKDGTAGLFALENKLAKNKWVFDKKVPGLKFAVSENKKTVSALVPSENSLSVHLINAATGKTSSSFTIQDIKGNQLEMAEMCSAGLFVADAKNCCLYKTDGTLLYSARFENQNLKSAWNYLCLTSDAYLIMCRKNWTLDAFRLAQSSSSFTSNDNSKKQKNSYPDFIKINTSIFDYLYDEFDNSMTDTSRITELKKGNFAQKEVDWASDILSTAYAYSSSLNSSDFGVRIEKTIFENDTAGLEKILSQLPYLVTSDAADCTALIIRRTNNISVINALLKGLSECGYDPEGKILAALEYKASKIDAKNVTSIEKISDAVCSVCIYMGKPAYFSKGRTILKSFMSSNHDSRTREHVRSVLQNLL